jgi:hypothetical protein
MHEHKPAQKISYGRSAGVTAVPTFFVSGSILSHLQQICACSSFVWPISSYLAAWVSGAICCCVPLLQTCLAETSVDTRHISYILFQVISLSIEHTHFHTHIICISLLRPLVLSRPSHVWILRSQNVDCLWICWDYNMATLIMLCFYIVMLHLWYIDTDDGGTMGLWNIVC